MSLKPLNIIAVGRLRTKHWIDAASHYTNKLKFWYKLDLKTIKDAEPSLPTATKITLEGEKILSTLNPKNYIICLDEHGKFRNSIEFSAYLQHLLEDTNKIPCFIIGGAFGLSDAIKKSAAEKISLSPMTLPHEMAQVLLLEQLYRAQTILHHIPYHH